MYLLIISYSLIGINFINNFLHILKYLLPFSLVLVLLYTRTTDANGVASFAISLPAGTYTMITTNPVTGDTKENSITVLSRFAENRDVTKYFRNATQYVLKVLGDDGKPAAAGEVVTFNINGVFYNRTVNATGHVKMNINLNPGNYVITAEYNGHYC